MSVCNWITSYNTSLSLRLLLTIIVGVTINLLISLVMSPVHLTSVPSFTLLNIILAFSVPEILSSVSCCTVSTTLIAPLTADKIPGIRDPFIIVDKS